ncbi:O-antigen ligase family protein [Vibrio renipiscarius]|uniref:O-antigen ligase family protein n=1 Tax=Vibrio renipiscarius TaxID=1461322 RepID=UPI00354F7EFF
MNRYNFSRNKIADTLITLPIIFAFTGIFLYENSAKNILAVISISCIISLCVHGCSHIKNQIKENKIIWALCAMVLYGIYQNQTHGYSNGLIKTYFFIGMYFSIVPKAILTKQRTHLLTYSLLASLCSLFFYYQQEVTLGNNRGSWDIGVLHYTVLSAWLMCFGFYKLACKGSIITKTKSLIIIFANGLIITTMQVRGSAIALIIIALLFLTYLICKKNIQLQIIVSLMLLVTYFAVYQSSDVQQRLTQTQNEITSILNGNLNTSIGYRLQMWKSAYYIIPESPLFGVGNQHKEIKKSLANQGIISMTAANFSHYHNEYINTLVKSGAVGLLLLLSLLFYPLSVFRKKVHHDNLPLLFLFLIYGITALTNVPFSNLQLNIFFLTISWIYSSNLEQEKI